MSEDFRSKREDVSIRYQHVLAWSFVKDSAAANCLSTIHDSKNVLNFRRSQIIRVDKFLANYQSYLWLFSAETKFLTGGIAVF